MGKGVQATTLVARHGVNALTATTFWKNARSFGSTPTLVTFCTLPQRRGCHASHGSRRALLSPCIILLYATLQQTRSIAKAAVREEEGCLFALSDPQSLVIFVCVSNEEL